MSEYDKLLVDEPRLVDRVPSTRHADVRSRWTDEIVKQLLPGQWLRLDTADNKNAQQVGNFLRQSAKNLDRKISTRTREDVERNVVSVYVTLK